jgi:hypothetical protein
MTSDELFDAAHPFPFLSLRDKLEDKPFIIIAPQPDDESPDRRRPGLRGVVIVA